MNWNQFPILEKAFRLSGTIGLFECSDDARWRIVKGMNTMLNRQYSPDELHQCEVNAKETDISLLRRISLVIIAVRTVAVYFGLAVILRFRFTSFNNPRKDSRSVHIVLLNSAGAVNRFSERIGSVLDNFLWEMFFIYNKQIFNILTRSENRSQVEFLMPRIPGPNTIFKSIRYAFQHAPVLEKEIQSALALPAIASVMNPIHEHICTNLIHLSWADHHSEVISKRYPNSVFLFDQGGDTGGKETFLIDRLNSAGRTTVVIQHGTLSDPLEYLPLAKIMLTCSASERDALIQVGAEPSRVYVVGAPIQTISDSTLPVGERAKPCNILVLATDEFLWLEKDLISMLQKSKELQEDTSKALRYHPSFTEEEKELWSKGLSSFEVRKGHTLAQEVVSASIIITFSLDAMISCLRRGKRTILGFHPSVYDRKEFIRFRTIPGIQVVSTSVALDAAIVKLTAMSEEQFRSLVTPEILTDHFGTADPDEIRSAINDVLYTVTSGK